MHYIYLLGILLLLSIEPSLLPTLAEAKDRRHLKSVLVSKEWAKGEFQITTLRGNEIENLLAPSSTKSIPVLRVFPQIKRHEIWGFGASVTESCLQLIAAESDFIQTEILEKLFDAHHGAALSVLRVPLGGNDFTDGDYTLNDPPEGELDLDLKYMNLVRLDPSIEFIKKAQRLNNISKIIVTPWTPPAWMKDTKGLRGGQLKKEFFSVYAEYLLKATDYMVKHGVRVDYLTAMNEPLIEGAKLGWNYPQGYMSVEDQYNFITNHLVPGIQARSTDSKSSPQVLLHDHNWDNSERTVEHFKGSLASDSSGIAGIAMHCYGGDFMFQKHFHRIWPNLATLNTECTANIYSKADQFDFQWWLENQILDSTQIGSRGGLGWNLCLNENGGPHNDGCPNCRGLITIDKKKNTLKLNPEYYALAQVSRYTKPGALVVDHVFLGETQLKALTFQNKDLTLVIVVRNPTDENLPLIIDYDSNRNSNQIFIPSHAAVTFEFI